MKRWIVGAMALLAAEGMAGAANAAQAEDARIRSRADLQKYLDHFNNKRYDQQVAYYAPDVVYKVGSLTLSNPKAIADFYRDFHQYVKEYVRVVDYIQDGDTVAVTMPSQFEAFKDYDKNGLTYKAGESRYIVSFIFYKLENGKIKQIRVARYNGPATDFGPPVPMK
jgi:hypothetical protein